MSDHDTDPSGLAEREDSKPLGQKPPDWLPDLLNRVDHANSAISDLAMSVMAVNLKLDSQQALSHGHSARIALLEATRGLPVFLAIVFSLIALIVALAAIGMVIGYHWPR
jgi:hypothetical protein